MSEDRIDGAHATDVALEHEHAKATVRVCQATVTTLLSDRQAFRHFAEAVNASRAVRQTWFPTQVARWYSQSALVALRRLVDHDPRTDSLFVLMGRMMAAPGAWTFEAVAQLWARDDQFHYSATDLAWLLRDTYAPWADETGRALMVKKVEIDQANLKHALRHVKTMVDKSIAHAERGWEPILLTFDDLEKAVDEVHEIVKPYITLVTGAGFSDMTPIEQTRWWHIFDSWKSLPGFPE
jgi:hypothetical protein